MATLGLIPARSGSKGLLGKNIRPLGGKPLIAWTVSAARQSSGIDRLIVSTDGPEIAAVAREYGCEVPFIRPAHLALDETPVIDVVLHALEKVGPSYEFVALLQPTSPFRTALDIDACLQACREGAPSCVSVVQSSDSPFWMYTRSTTGELLPVADLAKVPTRRQDLPIAYLLNGAVYVARVDWLREHRSFIGPGVRGYVMPEPRSVDIDSLADFEAAEATARST